jgi:hypothetical protein
MKLKEASSDNKEELLVCGIPKELKQRFKIRCVEQEVSMSEVIVVFIKSYVDQKIELKKEECPPSKTS